MFFCVCISFEELIDYLWLNYKLCTFITRFTLLFSFFISSFFLKVMLCILNFKLNCRSEIPQTNYIRKTISPVLALRIMSILLIQRKFSNLFFGFLDHSYLVQLAIWLVQSNLFILWKPPIESLKSIVFHCSINCLVMSKYL